MPMTPSKTVFMIAAVLCAYLSTPAAASTIEIKAVGVKFVPDIIYAAVGDKIAFRQMPTHFVQSVGGMWPVGAPKMRSTLGTDYDYIVSKEGVYVFKCPPHWAARMVGIMVVGQPADLEATLDRYIEIASRDDSARPAKGLLVKFRRTLPKSAELGRN